jgi:hypothetical protein
MSKVTQKEIDEAFMDEKALDIYLIDDNHFEYERWKLGIYDEPQEYEHTDDFDYDWDYDEYYMDEWYDETM